jgi:hypothetical protein
MMMKWEIKHNPRWTAWLIVLLGIVTVAHLWTHACAPYDGSNRLSAPTMESGFGEPERGHHDETAHPKAFTIPTGEGVLPAPSTFESDLALLPLPTSTQLTSRPGRDPPRGYRARAVLTRTLEICRC